MAGILVGFQPACTSNSSPFQSRPSLAPQQQAAACSSKPCSSAAPAGSRSLLSKLLEAAEKAEIAGASSCSQAQQTHPQDRDWMDEDEDNSDAGSECIEGDSEADEDIEALYLEEFVHMERSSPLPIPPPGRSNQAKLQAAIAQAQLAQLLHAQAVHQERLAEDMARQQQQQRQHTLVYPSQPGHC